MDGAKPYEFVRFGAMDGTKPYEFTGFGAMEGTKRRCTALKLALGHLMPRGGGPKVDHVRRVTALTTPRAGPRHGAGTFNQPLGKPYKTLGNLTKP